LAGTRASDASRTATIGQWLRAQGQSERAVERFWSVVLVSALGETIDRASFVAARKVFVDGFLASPRAYEVLVPRVPLADLWDRAGAWLARRGVTLRLRTAIERVEPDADGSMRVTPAGGSPCRFDAVIAAAPWWKVRRLFSPAIVAAVPSLDLLEDLPPAPITTVNLWFDRAIGPLPHATIVGRRSQWMFRRRASAATGHHYQVVISALGVATERERRDLLAEVRGDLAALWPEAGVAAVLHQQVVTHPAAVFSVRPASARCRPVQQTAVSNLILAGDWTATGWPATMEGAVRSGYLAVESLCRQPGSILAADLPQSFLTRRLAGGGG
jgi:squalene-associated FAD-dependent desaturase